MISSTGSTQITRAVESGEEIPMFSVVLVTLNDFVDLAGKAETRLGT